LTIRLTGIAQILLRKKSTNVRDAELRKASLDLATKGRSKLSELLYRLESKVEDYQ
jgi:hypothetical protein